MTSDPTVSVVMAVVDAAEPLPGALTAIHAQDYPIAEVVVAAADDVSARAARDGGAVVVHNPSGRTPTGLNLAISRSTGEVIVRVDAHSNIPPGYVSRIVKLLTEVDAENVGGIQVPVGEAFWEKAIAAAMSSPIGAGDARHRIGGDPGPVDTVYLGAFRRSTIDRLGGFNESFVRHQDYELNHRIRESGGKVWFDPSLRVAYRPRSSLASLSRQYFQYGQWKRRFSKVYPGSLRARQWAPPALVLALAIFLIGGFVRPWLLIVPLGYMALLAGTGLALIPRAGIPALATPIALAVMHVSWGLGFLIGQRSEE